MLKSNLHALRVVERKLQSGQHAAKRKSTTGVSEANLFYNLSL